MFYLLYHATPYLNNILIIIHYIYFVKKTNMSDLINMFIINTHYHIFVCNSYILQNKWNVYALQQKNLHHHDGKKYFVKVMTVLACHKIF